VSIDGAGLYQDDTGHDVRAEAKELMAQGMSPTEVTSALVKSWNDVLGDEDVYCAFYLALADTQCRLGRPDPDVNRVALDLIESGRDLRRWESGSRLCGHRKRVLTRLASQLAAPPSVERKVRVPKVFRTSLAVGDVFVHTADDGECFLLHVIGLSENRSELHALVQILDWDWTGELSAGAVARTPPVEPTGHVNNRITLAPVRGTDLPKSQTRMLGNWKPVEPDARPGLGVLAWAGPYLDRISRSIVHGGSGQM
jgi:hypothetical protein